MIFGKQIFVAAEKLPNQPFHTITPDSIAGLFCNSDSQTFDSGRVAATYSCKKPRAFFDSPLVNIPVAGFTGYFACFPEWLNFHAWMPKCPCKTAIPWIYTVSFFLPLALLRLSTCLPALVAMRTRNPWVLFLLVFDLLVRTFFMSKPLKVISRPVNHSCFCLSRLNWFGELMKSTENCSLTPWRPLLWVRLRLWRCTFHNLSLKIIQNCRS